MTETPRAPAHTARTATLRDSTVVFLVGNIKETMAWYQDIGFEARYDPGYVLVFAQPVK